MTLTLQKKRELLSVLNKIIVEFSGLTGDIAKLEISDNEQASKRVRKALIAIKNGEFKNLTDQITNIRFDINTSKGKELRRKRKTIN